MIIRARHTINIYHISCVLCAMGILRVCLKMGRSPRCHWAMGKMERVGPQRLGMLITAANTDGNSWAAKWNCNQWGVILWLRFYLSGRCWSMPALDVDITGHVTSRCSSAGRFPQGRLRSLLTDSQITINYRSNLKRSRWFSRENMSWIRKYRMPLIGMCMNLYIT